MNYEEKCRILEIRLREARKSQRDMETFGHMAWILFAVSTTLLALTWGGIITI